jgi:hypothetical protein
VQQTLQCGYFLAAKRYAHFLLEILDTAASGPGEISQGGHSCKADPERDSGQVGHYDVGMAFSMPEGELEDIAFSQCTTLQIQLLAEEDGGPILLLNQGGELGADLPDFYT